MHEYQDMTAQDWQIYSSTITAANNLLDPDTGLSIWESAAYLHNWVSMDIHGTCQFFFWHRYFLREVEKKLQTIDPRFSFFYFDHSRVYNQIATSAIWTHIGKHSKNRAMNSGIFSGVPFETTEDFLFRSTDFDRMNQVHDPAFWAELEKSSIERRDISYWYEVAEVAHGNFHCSIGGCDSPPNEGVMGSMYSPLDPAFYAHHAFIDYLWLQAQISWNTSGLREADVNFRGCDINTPLFHYSDVTFRELLDPSDLCVQYAKLGSSTLRKRNTIIENISSWMDWLTGKTLSGTLPDLSDIWKFWDLLQDLAGPISRGYFPDGYEPPRNPPPRLPKRWLDMNFRGLDVSHIQYNQNEIYNDLFQRGWERLWNYTLPFFEDKRSIH